MKTYERVEVQLHEFLTSALDGSEWWVSCLGRYDPGDRRLEGVPEPVYT